MEKQEYVGKTIEFKDNDDGEQDAIWDREMWGVIDTKGNEIIPCKYDELYCVKNSDNIFLVFENKKYNFITIDSETILELDFDFNMDYSASECFILEERYIVMKKQELEENQDYVKEFAYIYIYDLLDKKYIVYNSEINAQEVKDKINKDCKNIDIILNQIKE